MLSSLTPRIEYGDLYSATMTSQHMLNDVTNMRVSCKSATRRRFAALQHSEMATKRSYRYKGLRIKKSRINDEERVTIKNMVTVQGTY